jgi:hypothetical protein
MATSERHHQRLAGEHATLSHQPSQLRQRRNLTNWNGNTYEYDPFNNLGHFVSGSENWYYITWRTTSGSELQGQRLDLDPPRPQRPVLRNYDSHLGWGTTRLRLRRRSALASEGTATSFSDIANESSVCGRDRSMKASGVTAGCGAGQYCPDMNVSRAGCVFLPGQGDPPPACRDRSS